MPWWLAVLLALGWAALTALLTLVVVRSLVRIVGAGKQLLRPAEAPVKRPH